MAAVFAGVTIGEGLNFFVGPTDQILAAYTGAANIIDSGYETTIAGNWYFMIIATVIMTFVGAFVTENIIVPKLGRYTDNEDFRKIEITDKEKKGLKYARISIIVLSALFLYTIIPGLPGSGILLDTTESSYINQLFGYNSYFATGAVFIISLIFLVAGISYGLGSNSVKNDKDIARMMASAFDGMGYYIIIIFFASQCIAYLNYTNLGTIITVGLTKLLSGLTFSGIPLILLILIITMILNLLIPSSTVKWAIMAPVFVPMFMQLNLSPEFTQLIFRAGDSLTNSITPFLAYLTIFLAMAHKYNKKETTSIKKTFSLMYPYSIAFGLIWLGLIIGWYLIGLPIGPGAYPTV
jgi:aminobenzoyl-glutamate transport protein